MPDIQTTSMRLQQSLESTLTTDEQLRLKIRIGSSLLAAALLLVGVVYENLFAGQESVAGIILLAGALIASAPIFRTAVYGFLNPDLKNIMEQLVSLALLASLATGDYKTVILIPLIMSFAHFLEERSVLGAQAAIEGLKTLQAKESSLIIPGGEKKVKSEDLHPGDLIRIKPGEMFPIDGEVVAGQSSADQSSLTGETIPVDLGAGDKVFAGTMNVQGVLEISVTKKVDETSISKIVDLLKEAEQSRTPTMKLIERYASYYLPFVLAVAAGVLFITQDLYRVVAILVVSCPCALILASPTAMVSTLASASRNGVLIKNSSFLEVLGNIKTVIFDKTGTLTVGKLSVVQVKPLDGVEKEDFLLTAATAAQGSNHPVSRAIMKEAEALETWRANAVRPYRLGKAENFEEKAGFGITAVAGGVNILLGRKSWLKSLEFKLPEDPDHYGPIVWVARNDRVLGYILLADSLRPEAGETVQAVRALGINRVVLLTGDRKQAAAIIKNELNLDDYIAECLPSEKLEIVEKEQEKGTVPVMVVGDGINDALALTKSDVGIAMGAMGSDIAIQSADVALMGNDLSRLSYTINLSRYTKKTIYQNIAISTLFSIIMLVLAGTGIISPLVGAFMHNIGALMVVFNSSKLLRYDPRDKDLSLNEQAAQLED